MNHRQRICCAVLAGAGLAGAGLAAGCGAAGLGLGSLGITGAAVVLYALFAVGGATGCAPRGPSACLSIAPVRPAEDGGAADVEPPVGPCLQDLVGPCLQPPQPCLELAPHPCLSQPLPVDAGEPAPPEEPCLSIDTQICLSVRAPEDAGPPPAVHICLSDDTIEGEMLRPCLSIPAPPPAGSALPSARPTAVRERSEAADRLASAGVLSSEQLRRLARLRGAG